MLPPLDALASPGVSETRKRPSPGKQAAPPSGKPTSGMPPGFPLAGLRRIPRLVGGMRGQQQTAAHQPLKDAPGDVIFSATGGMGAGSGPTGVSRASRASLAALWDLRDPEHFRRASRPRLLKDLSESIQQEFNGKSLVMPAWQVFALIEEVCTRRPSQQLAELLQALYPHACAALADYEARRMPPGRSQPLDHWFPVRAACLPLLAMLDCLPSTQISAWLDLCAPAAGRMHWSPAWLRGTGNESRVAMQHLAGCLDAANRMEDPAHRDRMCSILAQGLSANEARTLGSERPGIDHAGTDPQTSDIDAAKLSRLIFKIPSSPAGNALLRQVMRSTGHNAYADAFLHPVRRQTDLYEVMRELSQRWSNTFARTAPVARATVGSTAIDPTCPPSLGLEQAPGALVLFFGGLDPHTFADFAERALVHFCANRHDSCIAFTLHAHHQKAHREILARLAARHDLVPIKDHDHRVAYVRREEVPPPDDLPDGPRGFWVDPTNDESDRSDSGAREPEQADPYGPPRQKRSRPV